VAGAVKWAALFVGVALAATGLASDSRCSPDLAKAAEEATDVARRSWRDLHDQYVRYVKRAACDDGGIAEGWSDAVGHLLARRWSELPNLKRLAKGEPDFLTFVLKHIDLTLPRDDLDSVRRKATAACPHGCDKLCEKLRLAVDAVDVEAQELR
jgi:hypothetical protein